MKGKATSTHDVRQPKVLLIFPPQGSPQSPHPSLPAIAGHLRSRGIDVAVRDLNLAFYTRILTREHLVAAAAHMEVRARYLGSEFAQAMRLGEVPPEIVREVQSLGAWERWHKEHPRQLSEVVRDVAEARAVLGNPGQFYDPDRFVWAMNVLDSALEVAALPFFPARLSLDGFEQPDCPLTIESLVAYAGDARRNLFLGFLAETVSSVRAEAPDCVGISIHSLSQVLAGLTLARLLKLAAPELHVNIGGKYFAHLQSTLAQRPQFFSEFADSLACGEGEDTLHRLSTALVAGHDLETVPGLLICRAGKVVATPEAPPLALDATGRRDLAGLPLERYLTPETVLTIQASRGCAWAKCTFCDAHVGVQPDHRQLDGLVAEIRHLRSHHGIRHFRFSDSAISPARLRALARRFLAERLDIRWFCNGQLESHFTPELFKLLRTAGLTMIQWEFESGSPRVCNLMRKGFQFDRRLEIMRGAARVGIWNVAYVMFGFPTETKEEAIATIETLCQNTSAIQSYDRSAFTLGRQAPLFTERATLGLVEGIEDTEELSTKLSYRDPRGMSGTELQAVMSLCTRRGAEAYDNGLWFFLRNRENIHLYLARHGAEWLARCSFRQLPVPAQHSL